ncbi:MAG: adenine phosphoribosyltransferase [Acidobacteria bacterium]|jgi:adenine phosphoribosyltransferase|nr:adenine phosphoribosyltransferase [Acidobacteriota bacterium]MDP7692729.1 adenine phosphoribosyltransferase [Vicinamibacterales bacterium]HJN45678.1 adenine phosphoribosyltransferase [Vicinamibacterales bacterium]
MEHLKDKIRHVPDFPKPGILYYDITTLLRDPVGLTEVIDGLTEPFRDQQVDVVVGIESRGFILGAAVADRLRTGFVPLRKPGKLPARTIRQSYDLEYGSDALEIHDDAIDQGQRVLIVDDLLATGGTARTAVDLVKKAGGEVAGLAFLVELQFLEGRARLGNAGPLFVALQYTS